MLLSKEDSVANVVSAWGPEGIRVGAQWLSGHIIICAETIIEEWAVDRPADLRAEDLERAIELHPEIILIGTGARLVMPASNLMQQLAAQRIGVEIMDTPAACRTYNVLVHEHRRVVAALFAPEN